MAQITALMDGVSELDAAENRRFIGSVRLAVWGDKDDVMRALNPC